MPSLYFGPIQLWLTESVSWSIFLTQTLTSSMSFKPSINATLKVQLLLVSLSKTVAWMLNTVYCIHVLQCVYCIHVLQCVYCILQCVYHTCSYPLCNCTSIKFEQQPTKVHFDHNCLQHAINVFTPDWLHLEAENMCRTTTWQMSVYLTPSGRRHPLHHPQTDIHLFRTSTNPKAFTHEKWITYKVIYERTVCRWVCPKNWVTYNGKNESRRKNKLSVLIPYIWWLQLL